MLERVLEEEVMDTLQDAEEYSAIDNDEVNQAFVAQVLELAPRSGVVLDVGTGPADIAVLLATRAPRLRIIAIDLGEHMLATARANVARAGLGDRIEVVRADAKATPFPAESFDMVISNSLVHHIPEPRELFAEVKRLMRPGAALFVKDLHRPSSDEEHAQLVETYARGCTPYQRSTFSNSLRASLTVSEVQAICTSVGVSDCRVRRCSDRHWCLERRANGGAVV